MAASLEDDFATPVRAHNVERALQAADLEDLDFDRARELSRWADSYGEPEEWCKKAQALDTKNEKLRAELEQWKAEAAESEADLAEIAQALRPFVDAAEKWAEDHDDEWEDGYLAPIEVISDDVIRARRRLDAAVSGAEGEAREPSFQSLILDLTRKRQAYLDKVKRAEREQRDSLYERGMAAGLSAALHRLEHGS